MSQAPFTSAPARPQHVAGNGENSALVIQLDDASPRSQRPTMPQHPYQQQQQPHQPKQSPYANQTGVRSQLQNSTEAGHWARAPQHPTSHASDRHSPGDAAAGRHHPAAPSSRAVPQRGLRPSAALRDDGRPISSSRSAPRARIVALCCVCHIWSFACASGFAPRMTPH